MAKENANKPVPTRQAGRNVKPIRRARMRKRFTGGTAGQQYQALSR